MKLNWYISAALTLAVPLLAFGQDRSAGEPATNRTPEAVTADGVPEEVRRLLNEVTKGTAGASGQVATRATPLAAGRFGARGEPLDLAAIEIAAKARQPALRTELAVRSNEARARVAAFRQQTGVGEAVDLSDGRKALLTDVRDGLPYYIATLNANAAKTISTPRLWASDFGPQPERCRNHLGHLGRRRCFALAPRICLFGFCAR